MRGRDKSSKEGLVYSTVPLLFCCNFGDAGTKLTGLASKYGNTGVIGRFIISDNEPSCTIGPLPRQN